MDTIDKFNMIWTALGTCVPSDAGIAVKAKECLEGLRAELARVTAERDDARKMLRRLCVWFKGRSTGFQRRANKALWSEANSLLLGKAAKKEESK